MDNMGPVWVCSVNNNHLSRGKRKDNDKWVEGYYVGETKGYISHSIYDFNSLSGLDYKVNGLTVGRCTGMLDKNKKLIFEGDIIRIKKQKVGKVEWGEYEWVLRYNDKSCYGFGWHDDSDITIIGNIHDNPELLEVQNG